MKINSIILSFLILTLFACKKEVKPSSDSYEVKTMAQKPFTIVNGKNCFKSIVKNKIVKEGKEIEESNILEVVLHIDNENVRGEYNYYPYKEKVNKGTFLGTINGNIAETICDFSRNKSQVKEEVIFKIEKNKISILGGEKEEINGVWKFKNKKEGFFMNEIPRINCVN